MMQKIAVCGLGKVGTLAATLLQQSGFSVTGFDSRGVRAELPFPQANLEVTSAPSLREALRPCDAVLSCLPHHLNLKVAKIAYELGLHYFDLTEDVSVTQAVRDMSADAKAVMVPQCGLAPGFIAIVGTHLANRFETIRSIKLRVGALPQHPTGLLGYAFNWSPEGVVNEYLNVIEDGRRKSISAMEWIETVYVNGRKLEAFTTSGGLGTMCETYDGRVENLDYKTLRYPGHVALMNFFFHELLMRDRRGEAGGILTNAKPPVDEDVVYVHASVEGRMDERLQRREFVRAYYPLEIAGEARTAIAWTTSASVCAVMEMVRDGAVAGRGLLKQEEIPLDLFLKTDNGAYYQSASR